MLLVFCFLKCLCINFPKLLCKHVEENDVLLIFGGPYYNVCTTWPLLKCLLSRIDDCVLVLMVEKD